MNRYKFQSRTEKLQETDVRVAHELRVENSRSIQDILTLDPDTSNGFKEVKKVLYPLSASLPLLIFNLAEVVKVCLKNLNQCPNSVLEILPAVAREVRQELAPFMLEILQKMTELCSQNLLLERIFSCISICLKYSVKSLHLEEVLMSACPLLNHQDSGARHLASQSFAFICRKDLKSLEKLTQVLGPDAWELCKFTINQFYVVDVLRLSWTHQELAKKVHLDLAYDRKFEKEVWDSIWENKGWEILKDWAVMCNGSTFPKAFLNQVKELCREEKLGLLMGHFVKYHLECRDQISWLLRVENRYQCLKLISGFQDDHPEEQVHEFVQKNSYKNKLQVIDFSSFSEILFEIFDENLENNPKEVFYLILFIFQNHSCQSAVLKNIGKTIQDSNDPEVVWLGLKVFQLTLNQDCPTVQVEDDFILRELGIITKQVKQMSGEQLWTASFLLSQNSLKPFETLPKPEKKYLTHATLRVPVCHLLSISSNLFKLAWEIVKDPASLLNEKNKITDLKRLEHYFDEDPEGLGYFLIGLYWERFSTLWTHVTASLALLSKKFPEVLWPVLSSLLCEQIKPPAYPEYYSKFSQIRDWTPVDYFYRNLLEALASSPVLINKEIVTISELFITFFNTEYLETTWLPLFPLQEETQNSSHKARPTLKLLSFLKVLSQGKSLKTLKKPELKEFLQKVCLSLLTDKNEEIRKLSLEVFIQFKETDGKKFLRNLVKDDGFKDALLGQVGGQAAVALCAARVFHKSQHTTSALNFILNCEEGHFLLELLPVRLKSSEILKISTQSSSFVSSFLKTLKNVISHCFQLFPDPLELAESLLVLHNSDSREVRGKTLDCLSQLVTRFDFTIEFLEHVLKSVRILSSSHFRPKIFKLVHSIVSRYPSASSLELIKTYLLALLSDSELETNNVHRVLECLCKFCLSCTAETISALLKAFVQVGCSPSFLTLIENLQASNEVTPLAVKLIKPALVKSEVREVLKKWIPLCSPRPVEELARVVLKNEDFVTLLACALEDPDKSVLEKLSATRRKGLITEKCYESQLEALHLMKSHVFNEPKAVVSCLSHFIISSELGIRTSAGNAFVHFSEVPGIEEILSACLKRSKDEEQVRSVLNVWNRLAGPLSNTQPDQSAILNFGHLQIHRRIRALTNSTEAPVSLIKKLILPLLIFYMFRSSSKSSYQHNFFHALSTLIAEYASKLSWHDFYKLLKALINEFENDEQLVTKSLSNILVSFKPADDQSCQTLYSKVMPKLRKRIIDKKDKRRPVVRKYVVAGLFKIISLQPKATRNIETSKLILILCNEFKHKEEETRDSVLKAVIELIKVGCKQELLLKEFNHSLDSELFALFLTRVLKTDSIRVTKEMLPVIHQVLLEYEQYSAYYHLSKTIDPKLITELLASTKTLQFVAQGLSENKSVTPDDHISLGLSLISYKKTPSKIKETPENPKNNNFLIQPGAASGSRPRVNLKETTSKAHQVFGMRLLKQGVQKSVEMDPEIATKCKEAALDCLGLDSDEAVIGALDVLKILGSSQDVFRIVSVAERAGEEVTIHALKTLCGLIKHSADAEKVCRPVLSQVIFSLQNPEMQGSSLKLLKIFINLKVMDELIYDAIEELPRIILSSATLTSQVCNLYIQFLLTYPLSEKRKDFHLDFLVKNIGCLSSSANEVILQAVHIILDKLPYEALKEYYDFLLLTLITALCNEDIEEYRKKYLELALKTVKINQNSSVLNKIIQWAGSEQKSLHLGCLRFLTACISEGLLETHIKSSQILSKVKQSEACLVTLSFLSAWQVKFAGIYSETLEVLGKVIEKGENLNENALEWLQSCPDDLLASTLQAVQNNTLTRGVLNIVSKASGPRATRKVSAVCRKLFGRGLEDERVLELLKGLLNIVSSSEFDRKALIKTLLVFSSSQSLEIKEILQEIFKELHVGRSQEEFLKEYSSVKEERNKVKEDKKAKSKLRMVAQPDLAARLKEKKNKKKKLLKKKKLDRVRN